MKNLPKVEVIYYLIGNLLHPMVALLNIQQANQWELTLLELFLL